MLGYTCREESTNIMTYRRIKRHRRYECLAPASRKCQSSRCLVKLKKVTDLKSTKGPSANINNILTLRPLKVQMPISTIFWAFFQEIIVITTRDKYYSFGSLDPLQEGVQTNSSSSARKAVHPESGPRKTGMLGLSTASPWTARSSR